MITREIARSSCGVIRDLTHSLRRRYAPPRAIPSSTPFAWHRLDNGSSSLRTHRTAITRASVFVPSADVPLGSVNQSPSELRVSFIVDDSRVCTETEVECYMYGLYTFVGTS